jgi:protein-S-isoprenylcysteine O-methyltransferase Ste14
MAEDPDKSSALTTSGFYRWVRHPLYFFSLLFIWLTPALTINLLIVFVLFTLYFYIGSIYEEKRLLAEFGEAYRKYQEHVPRLVPFPRRR